MYLTQSLAFGYCARSSLLSGDSGGCGYASLHVDSRQLPATRGLAQRYRGKRETGKSC